MRGHLIQGPSLACKFGDLPGGGHIPSAASPHTGLPFCLTPGHASHFPTYTHTSRMPCPTMAVP